MFQPYITNRIFIISRWGHASWTCDISNIDIPRDGKKIHRRFYLTKFAKFLPFPFYLKQVDKSGGFRARVLLWRVIGRESHGMQLKSPGPGAHLTSLVLFHVYFHVYIYYYVYYIYIFGIFGLRCLKHRDFCHNLFEVTGLPIQDQVLQKCQ